MWKSRDLVLRHDPKLRNRLLLPAPREGTDGFPSEFRVSVTCRVRLMPLLCVTDGLRAVPLFPLCSVFHSPFSMLCGWQYIAFPLPQCSNTLTNYIIHCFLPQSNTLMKFWRTLSPRKGWTQCAVEVVNIQWHLLLSAKTWVIPGKLIASTLAKARVLAPLFKKRFARELISQPLTGPAGCFSRVLGLGSSDGFRSSAFSSAYTVVRALGLQLIPFSAAKIYWFGSQRSINEAPFNVIWNKTQVSITW